MFLNDSKGFVLVECNNYDEWELGREWKAKTQDLANVLMKRGKCNNEDSGKENRKEMERTVRTEKRTRGHERARKALETKEKRVWMH